MSRESDHTQSGEVHKVTIETSVIGGHSPSTTYSAPQPGGVSRQHGGEQMMVWPAVTLLGFLVLTALVIAMGTQSTARYEREREERTSAPRHAAAEAVGAVHA
jgi:multisubunit Na+/H+ antiporter MnhC subunit